MYIISKAKGLKCYTHT